MEPFHDAVRPPPVESAVQALEIPSYFTLENSYSLLNIWSVSKLMRILTRLRNDARPLAEGNLGRCCCSLPRSTAGPDHSVSR